MLFRSLVPTSKEGQNSNNEEENTKLLEKIFLGVTSLVLVLIIVLIYVTNKTRKTQNRFKLLDNSGNLNIINQESHSFSTSNRNYLPTFPENIC